MNNPPFTLIDLTHQLNATTPSWNPQETFHLSTSLDYADCQTPVKFRVQNITCPAGIGTHMDAPSHCVPGGATIADLPLEQLCAPCVVIDLSNVAKAMLDTIGRAHDPSAACVPRSSTGAKWEALAKAKTYVVSAADIRAFESAHGTIQPNSFVIIRTGWDTLWNSPERYRNNLVFPSVSVEAAQLLLERGIMGLGVDTLSPDSPQSKFVVHHLLLSAGKIIVENVANADRMPATGAWCLIAPLKIAGGTESPIRLIGIVPTPNKS